MDGGPGRDAPPGGNVGRDEVEAAAFVALAGLDATRFLRTRDPLEQQTLLATAARAVELRQQLDDRLAVLIANAVGQVFGGKRG